MDCNVKTIGTENLESFLALLEETEAIPLVISGSSMTPFLVNGRDTVYLSRISAPLKRGDMVLYRRSGGEYVLHRIRKTEGGTCTMVGDAQNYTEPGIRQEQVLAVVTAVRRKGKLLRRGSFWWEFFEKIWIRMIPLRPMIMAAYTRLKK